MISPGFKSLGSFTLTAAGTQTGTAATDLDGMLAATIKARFAYGSGGTNAKLYIQTSHDEGTTWDDVACIVFGVVSETAIINLSKLTPKTSQITPSDGALSDDTVVDGIIGDRLRCKLVTTGTYGGSTVLTVSATVA